ncbi:MAG: hypothetical protein JW801_19380 [Bacteroidales bacterium]|nr:hypothetical protein [Bacteroidales bacterium]
MKNLLFAKILISFICLSLLPSMSFSQATLGLSAGAGVGTIKQNFTQNGAAAPLSFAAPGAYISAELVWDNMYIDMSIALLAAPSEVTLGSVSHDLSDYSSRMGMDFNAVGIGYLHPLKEKLSVGGALGFHVSSLAFTPENTEDVSLLRFGGYYGLIGLDLVPRIRYSVSDAFKLTISLPLGIDFGPMSEDVVVGGMDVGESPAIVQPSELIPEFTGVTAGIYITAGYFFKLNR